MKLLDVLVSEHGGAELGGQHRVVFGATNEQVLSADSHHVGLLGHLTESPDKNTFSLTRSTASNSS